MSKAKRNIKHLDTFTCHRCSIITVCEISNSNIIPLIRNNFTYNKPLHRRTKTLYSDNSEGMSTIIKCNYDIQDNKTWISTLFRKQPHWNGGARTNKNCATYLGVEISEKILANVFRNVKCMPTGNIGYDFVCGKGYKVDVKASCIHHSNVNNAWTHWSFRIHKNTIADYFLCIAFDNREDLNPLHIWLVPGVIVSHLKGASISPSTINKWSDYELTNKMDRIIKCCNIMKNATT